MNAATVKRVCAVGIISIATVIVLSLLFAPRISPEKDTIYYLYSSLIQGFAAIVGLLLVALGFGYEGLRKAQQVYWTDAQDSSRDLFGGVPEDYREDVEMIRKHVVNWFDATYSDLTRKQNQVLDRLESVYSTRSYTGNPLVFDPEMAKMWASHQDLKIKTYRYRKFVSSLGRFQNSNKAFAKLPQDFILGTAAPLSVFFASILFLGTIDGTTDYWPVITAGLIFSSILATVLVARFMQITIRILFGGGWIEGFDETGLPRPEDVQRTLERAEEFVKRLTTT